MRSTDSFLKKKPPPSFPLQMIYSMRFYHYFHKLILYGSVAWTISEQLKQVMKTIKLGKYTIV